MKRTINRLLLLVAASAATACIENDIPYPLVQLNIAGIEGKGFTVERIDVAQRTATLRLEEATDIRNVRITAVNYDAAVQNTTIDKETLLGQMSVSREPTGTWDLRTPLVFTLSLYQDYEWTIVAEQTIERRFGVAGQVGAAEIDPVNRIATAYVAKEADLTRIEVTDLRLEPEVTVDGRNTTSYSPSAERLSGDFTTVRFVDVTCHGRTERWMLYVRYSDRSVTLEGADAWSRVIWLRGSGIEGSTMGFRYREKGTAEWQEASDVTIAGGSFRGHIAAEPEKTYEIKAFCGDEESDPVERTTEGERQLPNGGMEEWSQPKSPWLPFLNDADAFWGTGNNGATTLGAKYNVTTPYGSEYGAGDGPLRPGTAGRTAAQLASRYVAVKLAAGNLFTGQFAGIRGGTHGVVNFGRPFVLRPTALRVWMKYDHGTITDLGSGTSGSGPVGTDLKVGDPDIGAIYVALGTWTKEEYGYAKDRELLGTDQSPVSIDTRDASTFFDPAGKDVIGYGEQLFTESVGDWTQITVPIVYRATDRRPTHIIVVCSASRYGDYFTGSRQSVMWVDDFELLYDWVQDFE